jgi:phosphosulfolactate phosphohydrolase-like enzyme
VAAVSAFDATEIARIEDSVSGRELAGRGYGDDVRYAIAFDVRTAVPILREGAFAGLV